VVGSICADFLPTLRNVVDGVRTLRRIYPLSLEPDAATLRVRVCPDETLPCGDAFLIPHDELAGWTWRPAQNAVAFEGTYVPPPLSIVRLEYALKGDE
jgi:hypothetical protein